MDFSPKSIRETETFTFNFVNRLGEGETIVSVVDVTASVISGTDASPASMVSGAAVISGTKVLQMITGGVANVYYRLRARAQTSTGQILEIEGNLRVTA